MAILCVLVTVVLESAVVSMLVVCHVSGFLLLVCFECVV